MTTPGTGEDAAPIEYRQVRYRPPAGATELVLVRHGASAPARPGRPFPLADGFGDPELAPEGVGQAEAVARRLGLEKIAAIYISTLRRTAQTAAPLAARLGLTPTVVRDLREVYLGEWEGGAFRQHVAQGHPLALRMLAEERWDVIPGAEAREALAARVRGALDALAAAHPDQRIAVFTHGGIIGQALSLATGSRGFAFVGAENGSLSSIVITDGSWQVRGYNEVAHLPC